MRNIGCTLCMWEIHGIGHILSSTIVFSAVYVGLSVIYLISGLGMMGYENTKNMLQ